MLDVSSSHIAHNTAIALASNKLNNVVIVQPWFDEGWIISVPDVDDVTCTTLSITNHRGLAAVLKRAQALQCNYVKLDSDGEIIDDLPMYEW